jgi:hypothetical protein
MWHAFGRPGNGEPSGTTFSFGCANVTKWSVPSFRIYKPLLSMFLSLGHTMILVYVVIITFNYNYITLLTPGVVCRLKIG